MTSSDLLTQRLQNQRQRAGRMLTPGLKQPAGAGIGPRLSPVLSGFGGSKYRNIAERLLSTSGKKLGKLQPESADTLSSSLPQKFSNNRFLLHIQPQANSGKSGWSEVEKVFPAQTAAGAHETPPQPGEMRQGSVIQKFEMTPRAGQSIDVFKKQVESTPKQVPAREPLAKKKLATNYRLFSRVEEIPDKQHPVDSVPSLEPSSAVSNTGPSSTSSSAAPSQSVVQRQPEKTDLLPAPSVNQAPVPEDTAEDVTTRQSTPTIVPPSQAAKETQPTSLPLAKSIRRKAAAETKTVQDNEKKVPPAVLHPKQAPQDNLPEILPTQKVSLMPVLQATPARRKNSLSGPQIPRAMSAASKIAQRQQEKPEVPSDTPKLSQTTGLAKYEPEKKERSGSQTEAPFTASGSFVPGEHKPLLPTVIQPKKETDSMDKPAVSSLLSPKVPSGQAALETPLKMYMARRVQPAQARFLNPEKMKPIVSPPKLAVTHPALVQRQKDVSPPREVSQPGKPVPASVPVPAPYLSAEMSMPLPQTPHTSAKPADLPLVRNASNAPAFSISKPNILPATAAPISISPQPDLGSSAISGQVKQTSSVQPAMASTSIDTARPVFSGAPDIVQREIDKPEVAKPVSKVEGGETSMDLDRLARDVMPRVKRILEIELERQAGFFRR